MNEPNLVGFDFADLRTALKDGGRAVFGQGEAAGPDRARRGSYCRPETQIEPDKTGAHDVVAYAISFVPWTAFSALADRLDALAQERARPWWRRLVG